MNQFANIQLRLYRQAIAYLIYLGLIFALTFGALSFFETPAAWRTPILVAVATICIVVQVGLGAQMIMATIRLYAERLISELAGSEDEQPMDG